MPQPLFHHAAVAGAGMAGLLAARVLSDHFDHVTVVERDRSTGRPEPRKGVPQGRHVHILLPRGLSILERSFPGLTRQLLEAGALKLNAGRDFAWFYDGGWRTRYRSDLELVAATRPLLEAHVAGRARALPNVTFRAGTGVEAPLSRSGTLTGVRVAVGQKTETITADLLVDATGRGSPMPRWLEKLGYASPATETIQVPLTYATCQFPRQGRPDWRALLVNGPASKRAGFCVAVEGDRWLVTLASLFDAPPPRDHDAFLAFARALPVRDLHDALRHLEPLTGVVLHRFPESRRRRYEHLRDLPAGLVAVGDAVCSFNPVYGQGITVAAVESEALDKGLTEARRRGHIDRRFTRHFYSRIAPIIDMAWQGVAVEDGRFPELAGQRTIRLRALQWYMSRVQRATHANAAVTDQFYRVIGFLDAPTALFSPGTVARVLGTGTSA